MQDTILALVSMFFLYLVFFLGGWLADGQRHYGLAKLLFILSLVCSIVFLIVFCGYLSDLELDLPWKIGLIALVVAVFCAPILRTFHFLRRSNR